MLSWWCSQESIRQPGRGQDTTLFNLLSLSPPSPRPSLDTDAQPLFEDEEKHRFFSLQRGELAKLKRTMLLLYHSHIWPLGDLHRACCRRSPLRSMAPVRANDASGAARSAKLCEPAPAESWWDLVGK